MEFMWEYTLDGPGMTNSTLCEGYRADGYAQYPAYWSPARGSHAHGWSTGPTMVLLTEILGIKLTGPMGRKWSITPHLTKWLSYAQGGFSTRAGKFEVKIKRMRDGGGNPVLVLEVSTPRNTLGNINWGGRIAANVEGGRFKFAQYQNIPDAEWINLADEEWKAMNEESMNYERRTGRGWQSEALFLMTIGSSHRARKRAPGVVDWEALEKGYINTKSKGSPEHPRNMEGSSLPMFGLVLILVLYFIWPAGRGRHWRDRHSILSTQIQELLKGVKE